MNKKNILSLSGLLKRDCYCRGLPFSTLFWHSLLCFIPVLSYQHNQRVCTQYFDKSKRNIIPCNKSL